jgi:hypothetical protein
MVKPINPNREYTAVHEDDADLPASEQTIWHYTALDVRAQEALDNDRSVLVEKSDGGGHMALHGGSVEYLALKRGMRPPENFDQPWSDEPAGARYGQGVMSPTDLFLNAIPRHIRQWLSFKIREAGQLTEEDAGKSSQQSTAPSMKDSSPTAEPAESPATND